MQEFLKLIDTFFGMIVGVMKEYVFFSIPLWGEAELPIVVFVLVFGAVFFTIYMKFINIRSMKHSFDIINGKYDNPEDIGDVNHFQALCAALSATVGLGNIAGVAIAVSMGGPGAIFWMVVAAFFGMSSKFVECTLALKYRTQHQDGSVAGGPMYYLDKGFAELGLKPLGKVMAVMFTIFLVFGS